MGVLFSRAFSPNSTEVHHIVQGRCLLVKAAFDHFTVDFINIYAPVNCADRSQFFGKINEALRGVQSSDYVFLGGDFNCTENESLDRNHAEPHPVCQCALRQLVSSHDLVDVWRRMHTSSRQFTWSHVRDNRISLARLDRFDCFQHHFNIFKTCRILPVGFRDHSLLLGGVFISKILPRSAYWHFNSDLTLDQSFREALAFFLDWF